MSSPTTTSTATATRFTRLERAFGGALRFLARRWLMLFALAVALFVGLAFAAPILATTGHRSLSDAIYVAYRPTCHQLPHRSWFIGGPAWTYDWPTVAGVLGLEGEPPIAAMHQPVRDPRLGYQVAFCERDTAIYGSFLAATLAYAAWGQRRRIRPISLRWYVVALVPIAVDGLAQLVGLHESTPLLRTLTGSLFGVATALLVLPNLEVAFAEVGETFAEAA